MDQMPDELAEMMEAPFLKAFGFADAGELFEEVSKSELLPRPLSPAVGLESIRTSKYTEAGLNRILGELNVYSGIQIKNRTGNLADSRTLIGEDVEQLDLKWAGRELGDYIKEDHEQLDLVKAYNNHACALAWLKGFTEFHTAMNFSLSRAMYRTDFVVEANKRETLKKELKVNVVKIAAAASYSIELKRSAG